MSKEVTDKPLGHGILVHPKTKAGRVDSVVIGFVASPVTAVELFTSERIESLTALFEQDGVRSEILVDDTAHETIVRCYIENLPLSIREGIRLLEKHLQSQGIVVERRICLLAADVERVLKLKQHPPSSPGK